MSDTPRTDAAETMRVFKTTDGTEVLYWVDPSFARQLERELNECKLLAIQLALAFAGRCDSVEELHLVEKAKALMRTLTIADPSECSCSP